MRQLVFFVFFFKCYLYVIAPASIHKIQKMTLPSPTTISSITYISDKWEEETLKYQYYPHTVLRQLSPWIHSLYTCLLPYPFYPLFFSLQFCRCDRSLSYQAFLSLSFYNVSFSRLSIMRFSAILQHCSVIVCCLVREIFGIGG